MILIRILPSSFMSEFSLLYKFHISGRETFYRKQKALNLVFKGRVIQTSPRRFIVESKKYMENLGKPSKMHIVNWIPPFRFWCDCLHTGVYPSPHNLCSHALAVLMSITLREKSDRLITLRDEALNKDLNFGSKILLKNDKIPNSLCVMCKQRTTLVRLDLLYEVRYQCSTCGQIYDKNVLQKLIEFNTSNDDVIPTTGNEYPDHIKAKKRIHDLLMDDQWDFVEYERAVHCKDDFTHFLNKFPYYLDVYAERFINGKLILLGVEIHGEKGHGTARTIQQDKHRAEQIKTQQGIKVVEFFLWQLKEQDDKNIMTEIYEKIG